MTHHMYSLTLVVFIHTGPRYVDAEYIGEGAYGTVVSALDTATQEKVNKSPVFCSPIDH